MTNQFRRIRLMSAITLVLIAAWALVTRAIEVGPTWLPRTLAILASVWMATLALTSLWFLLKARRDGIEE